MAISTAEMIEKASQMLPNAGITMCGYDNENIYFVDPACILPAFDTFISYAWTVICLITVFIIFGWAILYIRNGVRLDSISKNIKYLLIILASVTVVVPAIDFIYGNGALFEKRSDTIMKSCDTYKACEIHKASIETLKKLYEKRLAQMSRSDEYFLYENIQVTVSDESEDEYY